MESLELKRSLSVLKLRYDDNIKKGMRGIIWEGVNWVNVAQRKDRWRAVMKTVMNCQVS